MIRLLTIDCWDTILKNTEVWDSSFLRVAQRILNASGLSITESTIAAAFQKEAADFSKVLSRMNITIPIEGRIKNFAHYANLHISQLTIDELRKAFDDTILTPVPQLESGVSSFFERIHRANIKLCLISNTGWFSSKAIVKALEHHKVLHYFDYLVFSDEAGAAKPSKKIFDAAVARFNFRREDIIHIGDDLVKDVVGARNAGLHAVHFHSGGKCRGPAMLCASDYGEVWTILLQYFCVPDKSNSV